MHGGSPPWFTPWEGVTWAQVPWWSALVAMCGAHRPDCSVARRRVVGFISAGTRASLARPCLPNVPRRSRLWRECVGSPCCPGLSIADPLVPRDETDLMVEEEMEEDVGPAARFLVSAFDGGEADVDVRVPAVSPSRGLSSFCSGTTAPSAGSQQRAAEPLPPPQAARIGTGDGAGAGLPQDVPGGGGIVPVVGDTNSRPFMAGRGKPGSRPTRAPVTPVADVPTHPVAKVAPVAQ